MKKSVKSFKKALAGRQIHFTVAEASQLDAIYPGDMVKVEEMYLTKDGKLIIVLPDKYVTVDF